MRELVTVLTDDRENLYHWKVELFGFEGDLGRDLQKYSPSVDYRSLPV